MKSPLKWHGGKSYLAKKILTNLPPHIRYCEPYFGGGSVLFAKDPEGHSEAVNDIYSDLMNFWEVLRSNGDEFIRLASLVPLSDAGHNFPDTEIGNALAFFVWYRQSRQALGKDYVTPTKRIRRGMNEQVSQWLSAVYGLPEAAERLRRVEIRSMDALTFIENYDNPDTLFYCDPPYLEETRVSKKCYEHEMSEQDHVALLRSLSQLDGKFILSAYPSELYNSAVSRYEWTVEEIQIDNKASSQKIKPVKTELLIRNY